MSDAITESVNSYIIKSLSRLDECQQIEIFKIITAARIDTYTENANGIFIDINTLDESTLMQIHKYIMYCDIINKEINQTKMEHDYFRMTRRDNIINYDYKSLKKTINDKKKTIDKIATIAIKMSMSKVEKAIIGGIGML